MYGYIRTNTANDVRNIAEDLAAVAPKSKNILIDAFAGVGGNTIAFARTNVWLRVYAIEKDPVVLECAKHNAEIYGVQDRITWFLGDCMELLKNQLKDLAPYSIVFGSPPWGGESFLFCHVPVIADCVRTQIFI